MLHDLQVTDVQAEETTGGSRRDVNDVYVFRSPATGAGTDDSTNGQVITYTGLE